MNKSAQTAVPAVLLTLMALILWYVLWIYPEQRYELLFGTETPEDTTPETPISTAYYSTTVGEIGQSTGQLLDTQLVSDLSVSYPVTRSTISSYSNQLLTASILVNEHKTVDLSNVDADMVGVEVESNTVLGSPNLRISLNNTLIYDNPLLANSKTSLDIAKSSVTDYGNVLRITCGFNGVEFWTTQQCGFDSISVYEYVYAPVDLRDDDVFYLTPLSENAELVELSFTAEQATSNPVNILINNQLVFSGSLQEGESITMSLEGEDLNLGIDNTISLVGLEGADHVLTSVNLKFYSVPSGLAAKYLYFNIPSDVLEDEDYVTVAFNLTGIVEPGDIVFEIVNSEATYVLTNQELVIGTNYMEVLTSDLEENGNNMKISSTSGRFIIDGLEIK